MKIMRVLFIISASPCRNACECSIPDMDGTELQRFRRVHAGPDVADELRKLLRGERRLRARELGLVPPAKHHALFTFILGPRGGIDIRDGSLAYKVVFALVEVFVHQIWKVSRATPDHWAEFEVLDARFLFQLTPSGLVQILTVFDAPADGEPPSARRGECRITAFHEKKPAVVVE
jgi:hypothetical protein